MDWDKNRRDRKEKMEILKMNKMGGRRIGVGLVERVRVEKEKKQNVRSKRRKHEIQPHNENLISSSKFSLFKVGIPI